MDERRAWSYLRPCDEHGECIDFVHAATRGRAKAEIARRSDGWAVFTESRPKRCPAMDGLDLTPANMVRTGAVGTMPCWGDCGSTVYHDAYTGPGCSKWAVFSECAHDDDREVVGETPVFTWDGGVYCCWACYASDAMVSVPAKD